ncbi:hypothetical protein [Desulfosporosinus nitroreducens]|uniref:MOSC domain-containing protein n=1 Tax=Desulfosporosinus nitroreducens TaxID=2018668 RepID=A0ABT8QUX2_9FIRM|nr:hypothetical protein [Desulfosporosinus nitroreducens]MDO0824965.1 hypothetical protein [Desulfosporosinus nitroreducens]
MGQVIAVCTSECNGMSKKNVGEGILTVIRLFEGGAIRVGNSIEVIA